MSRVWYLILAVLMIGIMFKEVFIIYADPEDSKSKCDVYCHWVCSEARGKYTAPGATYYYRSYHESYWPGWALWKDWNYYGYDENGYVVYAKGGRLTNDAGSSFSRTYSYHVTYIETRSKRYPSCYGFTWIKAIVTIGPPGTA